MGSVGLILLGRGDFSQAFLVLVFSSLIILIVGSQMLLSLFLLWTLIIDVPIFYPSVRASYFLATCYIWSIGITLNWCVLTGVLCEVLKKYMVRSQRWEDPRSSSHIVYGQEINIGKRGWKDAQRALHCEEDQVCLPETHYCPSPTAWPSGKCGIRKWWCDLNCWYIL